MRGAWLFTAVGVAAVLAGPARAQSGGSPDGTEILLTQVIPPPPSLGSFPLPAPAPVAAPAGRPAARPAEPGTLARSRVAPHMIGDLATRGFGTRVRIIPAATVNAQPQRVVTRFPVAGGGAFKIAENESPRPVDRFFLTYNYFDSVNTFGGRDFDIHREVFGFERTVFGGDASIGLRVPVLQRSGADGANFIDGFGDLSLVFKVAFLNDEETGDVLSGGLVLTVPTGRDVTLVDGTTLDTTFFQPWVGFIANSGRGYLQGFSSVVIPTRSRDVTFLSNDVGVGYRLYESDGDGVVTLVAPTVEGHLFTPLSNRGDGDILRAWDSFTVTTGVHVGLWNRAFLTAAIGVPLVGPRPNDFEAIVQFNLRY